MSTNSLVLVFVEVVTDNGIIPQSLESLASGRRLADALSVSLAAVVLGSGVSEAAERLKRYNIDLVYIIDDPLLKHYQPDLYLSAFQQAYQKVPTIKAILMANTLLAIDFAPRLAYLLQTGFVTDCVDITYESGECLYTKPVYSSNIMAQYCLTTEPHIVTMRARADDPLQESDTARGKIIPIDIHLEPTATKTEVIERVLDKDEGFLLENAQTIVAGGRGIGGPEGFLRLAELARILDGAVAASRPPCDLGWVSPKLQVGQTGTIVGPDLYIAVGISGASAHLAGMMRSKVVVAINKDPQASIFNLADYGIVGKYEDILPSFINSLKEIRPSQRTSQE